MNEENVFAMPFSRLYPLYVAKAEKKGRSEAEVKEIICWLCAIFSPRQRSIPTAEK